MATEYVPQGRLTFEDPSQCQNSLQSWQVEVTCNIFPFCVSFIIESFMILAISSYIQVCFMPHGMIHSLNTVVKESDSFAALVLDQTLTGIMYLDVKEHIIQPQPLPIHLLI